jgi:transcription initiation factor TFIID subunit TAF12
MSDVGDKWPISKIVQNLEIFSFELSHLASMNDKLQFAEESVDRLEIALSQQHRHSQQQQQHQHQQQQQQQLRKSGSIPNLTLNGDEAKNHLFCARTEVERLRVINENVGREIAQNQKHLHNLDAAVKSKRSGRLIFD